MIKKIILKLGKSGKRITSVPLFDGLVFFFPVLMKSNCANYQSKNNHSKKSKTNFIHKFYSPLSRKIPSNRKRITIPQPIIYDPIGMLFGEAILPTIITAKTIWLKLNSILAMFSFCFFVNLIGKTLSKAEISVKQAKAKVILPADRAAVGFFGKD